MQDGNLPPIIFVLGGPGTGKGTQCRKLKEKYGFSHISAGDLLRAEAHASTNEERKHLINDCIKNGSIVPAEVTVDLLKTEIEKPGHKVVLVDGFPRGIDQAEEFRRRIGDCAFVIRLFSDENTMTDRLLKRGATSGRSDDNLDSIKKRFRVEKESCARIIAIYKEKGMVREVDASGDVEDVWSRVKALFAESDWQSAY